MNKDFPRYLYANAEGLGAGVIIHSQHPLIIGRIILYDNYQTMSYQLNNKPPLAYAVLPGYSIAILFGGILGESKFRMTSEDDIKVIEAVLNAMAAYYYNEKIAKHKPRYRRYEI